MSDTSAGNSVRWSDRWWRRFVVIAGCVAMVGTAACGGKSGKTETPKKSDSGSQPDAGRVLVKAISIAWALEDIEETADHPARTRVSIAMTNETGSTTHEVVGVFDGGCKDAKAETSNPEVVLALRCTESKRGAVLHMVKRPSGLVFLRAHVFPGESELSFDVLKSYPLPAGAVVEVGE